MTIKEIMNTNNAKTIIEAMNYTGRRARQAAVMTIIPWDADITCREVLGMIVSSANEERIPESSVTVSYSNGILTIGKHSRRIVVAEHCFDDALYARENAYYAKFEAAGLYD